MRTVLEKLRDEYLAATTTHLTDALVYVWDAPTTPPATALTKRQRATATPVEVTIIPLPSEDEPVSIGDGWYDRFRVNIRARYPREWEDDNKHLDLAEECKQVIRDNWAFVDDGEQAVLRSRRWGYGYEPKGEQRLGVVDLIVEYEAPGLSATA